MEGKLNVNKETLNTSDEVIKHKVAVKKSEVEERLRQLEITDLINVKEWESRKTYLNNNIDLLQ